MLKTAMGAILLGCWLPLSCHDSGSCPTCPPQASDTTSHAFSWSSTSLGVSGSLYDVVIINDTLAYAVGQIFVRDTAGQLESPPYCLAIWNGTRWQLNRLYYNGGLPISIVRGICVGGPGRVWLASGSVFSWDGVSSEARISFSRLDYPEPTPFVTKIWGTDNSVYGAGNGGTIVYFDGSMWHRLESGSTLDIRDIWGGIASKTGELQVLAVASNDVDRAVFSIRGMTVSRIVDSGLPSNLRSIWFVPNENYMIVGQGISQSNSLSNLYWSVDTIGGITSNVSERVRGSGQNDVFVVGNFMEMVHFNGFTWYNYRNEIPFAYGALGGVAIRGDLAIAVGRVGQAAVAVVGRRH
jgi:hypothetical protein